MQFKIQDCALIRWMGAYHQEREPTTLAVSSQNFSRPGGPTQAEGSFMRVSLRNTITAMSTTILQLQACGRLSMYEEHTKTAGYVKPSDQTIWNAKRHPFKVPETQLITTICNKYLSSLSAPKILEIGAGILDRRGSSYLMERLPPALKDKVIPTDGKEEINQEHRKFKHVKTTELDKVYPENTLDAVIGSSVLDAVLNTDLDKTIQQIHKILKLNGVLIHFSSLQPHMNIIIEDLLREDKGKSAIFPWICLKTGQTLGVQLIPKENLLNFCLLSPDLTDAEKGFLATYGMMSQPHMVEMVINHLCMQPDKLTSITSVMLSKWISHLNPSGLQQMFLEELFQKKMKAVLQKHQFEIVHLGRQESKTVTINRPTDLPPNFNQFNRNSFHRVVGIDYKEHNPSLKKDQIQLKATLFVIIAKKSDNVRERHLKETTPMAFEKLSIKERVGQAKEVSKKAT